MNQKLHYPKCAQVDMVQKVSTIFYEGIHTTTYSGPSVVYGNSRSLLSNRLAPPIKPSSNSVLVWVLIIIGLLVIFIGGPCSMLSGLLQGDEIIGLIVGLISTLFTIGIGVAIIVLALYVAKQKRAETTSKMTDWQVAMSRWNKLYYCKRDDGVFDPDERHFIPIEQISDYLY